MISTQPVLGGVLSDFGEDPERPGQPSVLYRPIAENIAGDPRQDAGGHVWRRDGLTLPAVSGVGAFVLFDGVRVVALQVKRLTEPFSRAAGLDLSEGILEGVASRRGVARRSVPPNLLRSWTCSSKPDRWHAASDSGSYGEPARLVGASGQRGLSGQHQASRFTLGL